jgi:hypothetical protein
LNIKFSDPQIRDEVYQTLIDYYKWKIFYY